MAATTEESKAPWSDLLGSKNWNGLLQPFNIDLRNLILRCGDFCQATYDAFNNDEHSKYTGSSRYGKKSFFQKVMLQNASDYQISAFLYATAKVNVAEAFFLHSLSREAWDRESNWIGYIATTTDEVSKSLGRREIYVVWRGTSRGFEWINVLGAKSESAEPLLRQKKWRTPAPATEDTGDLTSSSSSSDEDESVPKVMKGWLSVYVSENPNSTFTKLSARTQLLNNIKQLVSKYENEEISIIITGHSLGASLSILSAFDLAENGMTNIQISAFVFGSPQVGNKAFDDRLNEFSNVKILHIKNKIDVIPLYPSGLLGYVNSGVLFEIDTRKSESLKRSTNTGDWHNLQGMLHVVAGWNGEDGEFELKVERSVALVNKSSEFLKDELLIPGSWWIEKNKGMVMDENGGWSLEPPAEEDLPENTL